jgi:Domain of unknown function DUF29
VKAVELYDRDFFEWTQYNAALLREGRLDEVDVEHLAEQVEDLAMPFRQELKNRLEILLQHLLKWQFLYEWREPGDRCWRVTIDLQRLEIKNLLEDMPSLRETLEENWHPAYRRAVSRAALESARPDDCFPASCPYTLEETLDQGFFPENR